MERTKLIYRIIIFIIVSFALSNCSSSTKDKEPEEVFSVIQNTGVNLFCEDFNNPDSINSWKYNKDQNIKLIEGYENTQSVFLNCVNERYDPYYILSRKIPVKLVAGKTIRISANIKAGNISTPPETYNGIKLMLYIKTDYGEFWHQAEIEYGSFDWKEISFTQWIPDQISEAHLVIGLEEVYGKVWFDNIAIVEIIKDPLPFTYTKPEEMFTGYETGSLRGAMIGTAFSKNPELKEAEQNQILENIRVFGSEWNGNILRWQLTWIEGDCNNELAKDLNAYYDWLNMSLDFLDNVLLECEKNGILIIIDLHSAPGGRTTKGFTENRMFLEKEYQEEFIEVWKIIAGRYKNNDTVWAYDLVNEPIDDTTSIDCFDWNRLAWETSKQIREIDPHTVIIIEPAQGGSPEGFLKLYPLDIPNIIYSVHMYSPFSFTHQGIYGLNTGIQYPGEIDGLFWDKEKLCLILQPVRDFQLKYNVHIIIGEFSAIRIAPDNSSCRYISDAIDIFEEYEWDWIYHAFREWHGWSVEHTSESDDLDPSITPTCRENLLRSWFEQNY